ncbi:MAG TPA: hypothetical protein VF622_14330, partial [Segetibacter sp.]
MYHFRNLKLALVTLLSTVAFISCTKDQSENTDVDSLNTIAVLAELTATAQATGDSVYIIHPCDRGAKRDSIAQSALPASVATYLSANYSGNTFHKAFATKSSSSATTGYVVVI